MHKYLFSRVIDITAYRLMDAANIQNKLVINIHPKIVIARELINNIFTGIGFPIYRNCKVNLHTHAKMMIKQVIKVHTAVSCILHRCIIPVEGEEPDRFCIHRGTGLFMGSLGVLGECM